MPGPPPELASPAHGIQGLLTRPCSSRRTAEGRALDSKWIGCGGKRQAALGLHLLEGGEQGLHAAVREVQRRQGQAVAQHHHHKLPPELGGVLAQRLDLGQRDGVDGVHGPFCTRLLSFAAGWCLCPGRCLLASQQAGWATGGAVDAVALVWWTSSTTCFPHSSVTEETLACMSVTTWIVGADGTAAFLRLLSRLVTAAVMISLAAWVWLLQ